LLLARCSGRRAQARARQKEFHDGRGQEAAQINHEASDALTATLFALSPTSRNFGRVGSLGQTIAPRSAKAWAIFPADDDEIISQCLSHYSVSYVRDCLEDDGCPIPEECELLSLDDLDKLELRGSRFLMGSRSQGNPPKKTRNRSLQSLPTMQAHSYLMRLARRKTTLALRNRNAKKSRKQEESARYSGLARALKDGTRKSHSLASNTKFTIGFFKGVSNRASFAQMVASLYFVYRTMEKEFDTVRDESVKALDFPELRRLRSLEEDMAYFYGDDWRTNVKPTLATQRYCCRIRRVAREQPYLLIAHMYARYLGDLFGGQMIRTVARSTLELDEGFGTRFYEFDDIPKVKEFIERWSTRLNQLHLNEKQQLSIVREANRVFSLNIGIFNELDSGKRDVLWAFLRFAGSQFDSMKKDKHLALS
jgi:heme oxygenase